MGKGTKSGDSGNRSSKSASPSQQPTERFCYESPPSIPEGLGALWNSGIGSDSRQAIVVGSPSPSRALALSCTRQIQLSRSQRRAYSE